ncbi:hypothetical protein ELH22_37795 [Rhizobium ruizarguesonis]|uniref:hypothetical protein n=1 Tax=Rhizobium ruizarguesonis TaxID=2081791 RepID=UPI00103195D9|nr:hypothetical protein [Rhizobium ruizarguesonis]TBD50459.1 hypothetical protein ELH22_37795 [Rhizobium ruizarguesonis]
MPIESIHTYLVYPNKGVEDAAAIVGSEVPHEGEMFDLLKGVYEKADTECTIGIVFNKGANGAQENDCRNFLLDYAKSPTVDTGRILGERLSGVTTKRSGLGLLFLLYGKEGLKHKVVLSRFRANNGVLVNEAKDMLTVEFIDRVFMKNAHSYKAVVYQDQSLLGGFWDGMAVDKQINSQDLESSDYWVKEFLNSSFKTSPASGTRRLALALKQAIRDTKELEIKRQISAAVTLADGLNGQPFNVNDFCERFGFTKETKDAVAKAVGRPDLAADNFLFDTAEFTKQLPYRTVELDSGAMLTAHSADFDEVFDQQEVGDGDGRVRFSTTGTVVGEKLEKIR